VLPLPIVHLLYVVHHTSYTQRCTVLIVITRPTITTISPQAQTLGIILSPLVTCIHLQAIDIITMTDATNRHRDDTRYAVDIRVFVIVIVISMALSFGIGVGLGPASTVPISAVPASTPLPPVTSVQVAEAEDFVPDDDLHEPAGQVSRAHVLFPEMQLLMILN
jgi:hypothetical protein